ncbi:hypothetical protein [Erythrobacter donghaensis]|uniref:hypothetical protein n=1 Tax=Erythrobacter donghaensis TaxID=267135 RepID=UPI000A3CB255|nr:hypothetical protein [Erythrobacter donghaensis]
MNDPVKKDPLALALRGCGCVLIAAVSLTIAGALLLGGVLGDCIDDAGCIARKQSASVWLIPLLVLVAGGAIGAIFLRITRRRD